MSYTPVFEKEGRQFIINKAKYIVGSEEEAQKLGIETAKELGKELEFVFDGVVVLDRTTGKNATLYISDESIPITIIK